MAPVSEHGIVGQSGFAIHRTFLARDGTGKAPVKPQRMTLGPYTGGAIGLDAAGAELVVSEGIETVASLGRLLSLPAWAAMSAGNLGSALVLPPEVRRVAIAVDNDPAGRRAAEQAARRWCREGRQVRFVVPKRDGADFNDVLRERHGDG
jgi:phage/plasmid primase-like uncharacterized protein